MSNYEYNFWDDRTHELDIHPCKGCKDFVDGECTSNGACGEKIRGGRMSKASKDYQKIIKQLDELKDHCSDMAKDGEEIWETDVATLQEAMDIIADYEAVVDQNNRMVEHYETETMTIKRQKGIYVCPNCGKRVQVGHSHCHWCGKKVSWDREAYASRDYPHLSSRGGKNQ